jgi:hypothetical protein
VSFATTAGIVSFGSTGGLTGSTKGSSGLQASIKAQAAKLTAPARTQFQKPVPVFQKLLRELVLFIFLPELLFFIFKPFEYPFRFLSAMFRFIHDFFDSFSISN